MQINKKTLRSEHVTYLLWGYAEVQTVIVLFLNYNQEFFFLKIFLLFVALLFIISLFKEVRKVKEMNRLLVSGKICYGKITPTMTRMEHRVRMRASVTEIRVVCVCEGKPYDGKIDVCSDEQAQMFLDILNDTDIPIVVGDSVSYVALEELANEHEIETDYYSVQWFCGWLYQAVIIVYMIKIFFFP